MSTTDDDIYRAFRDCVNMSPKKLEEWLDTDDSRAVGAKDEGRESVGHASGRRIVKLLRTHKADLDADDYAHMAKVVGYVKRHMAQGPTKSDPEHSRWRYSLMNWGHDPMA